MDKPNRTGYPRGIKNRRPLGGTTPSTHSRIRCLGCGTDLAPELEEVWMSTKEIQEKLANDKEWQSYIDTITEADMSVESNAIWMEITP